MANSPIARIKELDQERAQLISTGKKDALGRAKVAIDELAALGFNYRLVEGGKESNRSARTPTRTQKGDRRVKDAPCPVCEFKTNPAHDARKHRGQGKRKRPFTPSELKEFGLEKV